MWTDLSTDHSPITISISKNKNCIHGQDFWKFDSSLISDQNHVRKAKILFKPFTITKFLFRMPN